MGHYDSGLVALSVLIAIFASYSALELSGRVKAVKGAQKFAWLCGASLSMGIGIWSMHYVGMEAFRLPVPVLYDWPTVLLSMAAAIAASAVALFVVSRQTMGIGAAIAGSVLTGAGIASTHYIGMNAMRLGAMCSYSPDLVVLSVLLAGVISFVALSLTFSVREQTGMCSWRKSGSALLMGLAIPLMHYVGMAAVSFTPAFLNTSGLRHAIGISELGTTGIGGVTLIIIATVVLTSTLNWRAGLQVMRERALLASIVENSDDAIIAISPEGIVASWNRGASNLFGYTAEEITGRNAELLAHPDHRHHARTTFASVTGGLKVSLIDSVIRRRDGSSVHVSVCASPILGPDGGVTGCSAIFRDITPRRHSEAVLKESSDRLHLAIRAGAVGIFEYNPVEGTTVWDDQMFRLYGTTPDRFGANYEAWRAALHPDDRERTEQEFRSALRGEREFDTEFRVVWDDGSVHDIRALAIVQRDTSGQPIRLIGTNYDITSRKQAALQLQDSNRKLELAIASANSLALAANAASVAKSRFLANMSHEIRTPMNGVLGMIQLLSGTELTEEQRQCVTVAHDSGRALLSLIDDILDLSKIEAGKITLENVNFDLRRTIENALHPLRIQALSRGVEIHSRIGEDIPRYAIGDGHRLRQVLTNLSSNALKFTERGAVTLAATIIEKIESQDQSEGQEQNGGNLTVRFAITDTGIGIRQDQIALLFAPFVQADSSTTRRFGGTGLGLAICKQIVGMMGGNIGVTSDEGQGSTFWFTAVFDRVDGQAPSEDHGERRVRAPQSKPNMDRSWRILVAEDNPTNRLVALAQLTKLGHNATAVNDGAAAVEAVRTGSYDLVLMDCHMPVMDGFAATRLIRQSFQPHIPIIALTASAMQEDRDQCLAEMNDFVTKPVDLARLAAVLTRWLPAGPTTDNLSLPTSHQL
jgi:PAS domain S-box-containing protein